jgi:hypothetical protein
MIAERIDGDASNFRILIGDIIFCNKRLDLVAHCLINSSLASDCSETCSFSAASSLLNSAPIPQCDATHFRRPFTLR